MIKDTFFSLPRFMNLCRKEMVESWKSNALWGDDCCVGLERIFCISYSRFGSFSRTSYGGRSCLGIYINSFSLVSIRIWLFKRVVDNGEDEKQDKQAVCINDTGHSF